MENTESPKVFNTLKGFLNNEEEEEEIYFSYSATLRIQGENVPFDEINERLGVQPTSSHRKGEFPRPNSAHAYQDDSWHFKAPLPESEPLERHIEALYFGQLLSRKWNISNHSRKDSRSMYFVAIAPIATMRVLRFHTPF